MFCIPLGLLAQQPKPYVIHKLLGPKIDQQEYRYYKLDELSMMPTLPVTVIDYVQCFEKQAGGGYPVVYYLKGKEPQEFTFSAALLERITTRVEKRARRLLANLELLKAEMGKGSMPMVAISTHDGNSLNGQPVLLEQDALKVSNDLGEFTVRLEDVRDLDFMMKLGPNSDQYVLPNPNSTRYFFAPSAIPLGKGEGYYQNIGVFGNIFSYGLSDHVAITGGFEFASTLVGIAIGEPVLPTLMANLKVSEQVAPNFYLGAGAMGIANVGNGFNLGAGILYGEATYGNPNHNLSLGLGWPWFALDGESEISKNPIIMLGGMTRVSNTVALVTENWIVPNPYGTFAFISAGPRIMLPKVTFDLALVLITVDGAFIPAPYIDVVFPF
jgi:hypothetical protein